MERQRITNRFVRRRRGGRILKYLVATLVVAGGIGGIAYVVVGNRARKSHNEPLPTKVVRSAFEHSVIEQGEVESSVNVEIKSQVKTRNTSGMQILWVIPEGSFVKEGDVVVRLDGSALEQERDQQKIACNTSLAIKVQAENLYRASVIARTEYLEGTFQQEKQTIQSEIFVAEETLRRAEQYAKYSQRLAGKGYLTALQLEADRFAVEKAKNDLELAKRKLFVLENYTREKTLRTLESDIATNKAKWESEEESYRLELKKLADIEEQLALCTIRAPQDGQIVYANVPNPRGGTAEFIVEPGSTVREGQAILRMPDTKNMQVKAKINESRITNVRVGQQVTIRIDALGDEPLRGVVKKVNSFAEPASWHSSAVKQYATEITILDPPPDIRTGLTAEVAIHVERVPDALQVPIQSVVENGGKTYVLAQTAGKWEPVEVKIGSTNDKFVRIESGLNAEQVVAANPRQHLDRFPFSKNKLLESIPSTLGPDESIAASGPAGGVNPASNPAPGGASKGPRRSPAELLAQHDADGDGKLSMDEWQAVPEGLRGRLGNVDTTGDGFVDASELAAAFGSLRTAAADGGAPGQPPVDQPPAAPPGGGVPMPPSGAAE